jgi:peptide chain release factor subunit 1
LTTKLGPDQTRLHATFRALAEAASADAPILSVYIDVRPSGEAPSWRTQLTVIRDRLREIRDTLEAHGPERDSFDADRGRIEGFIDGVDFGGVSGIAIFACGAIELWETVHAETAFETRVTAGPAADLFQLARLLADEVSAIVAIVDTNSCRLFVTRRGGLQQRGGPDEPPDEHRRHAQGGWSQARYQRHIDMQDRRFAKEAADAIVRLAREERAQHVILAGHERALTALNDVLPDSIRPLVDHIAHIDMRARAEEVREEVLPVLAAIRAAETEETADRLVAGVRAGELGVGGLERTKQALLAGQVDALVIDESADLDECVRADLVRQAALTDASIEVVNDHAGIRRLGGVGATLRWR